jgi:hypothetical protein
MKISCFMRLLSKLVGSSFVAAENSLKGNVLPVFPCPSGCKAYNKNLFWLEVKDNGILVA